MGHIRLSGTGPGSYGAIVGIPAAISQGKALRPSLGWRISPAPAVIASSGYGTAGIVEGLNNGTISLAAPTGAPPGTIL